VARPLRPRGAMKAILITLGVALAGCEISPVVTDPTQREPDPYHACRRAARDYCKEVVQPSTAELDRCVADRAYRCLSGGA